MHHTNNLGTPLPRDEVPRGYRLCWHEDRQQPWTLWHNNYLDPTTRGRNNHWEVIKFSTSRPKLDVRDPIKEAFVRLSEDGRDQES